MEAKLDQSAKENVNLGGNDLASASVLSHYSTGKDQYLGVSEAGIGGRVIVRITYSDDQLKKVEVLEEHESEDVGQKAMDQLPKTMVELNTYEVDSVTGASTSSRALKSAVKDAEQKAKHATEN